MMVVREEEIVILSSTKELRPVAAHGYSSDYLRLGPRRTNKKCPVAPLVLENFNQPSPDILRFFGR